METMIEQPQSMTMTARAVQEMSTFNDLISAVIPYGDFTVEANGIGQVEEGHKAAKRLNTAIEKKRVELKKDPWECCKMIDSIAKQLSEKVDGIESKLKAERDAFDSIEKAEKAAKEAAKQAAKQQRLDDMVAYGIPVDLAAADLPEEEWMWWLSKAKKQVAELAERIAEECRHAEAFAEKQRTEREELAAKMRAEEEAIAKTQNRVARMEALGVAIGSAERVGQLSDEQFEHDYQIAKKAVDDRRDAEEAEQKRQAEELRVRAEEIEKQRRTDEAAIAEQRQAIEKDRAEMRRQQQEVNRQQAELRAKAEAEAAELRRKEQEEEAARKAEAEAARLETLKPEIDKAHDFTQSMITDAQFSLQRLGNPAWAGDAMHAIRNCGAAIIALVVRP
jgi:hypothetical protein